MFGGANAFLETRLGSDSDDLRTFGDGSGRRLRQGRNGRRSRDPRYRRTLFEERSQKRHLWAGPRGAGPGPDDLQSGLSYDDVPILANGVQSDHTQNLPRRLVVLAHVIPLLGANEE